MDALSDLKTDDGGISDRRPKAPAPARRAGLGFMLGQGIMAKMGMGICCSIVASVVLNLPFLRQVIVWICHAVVIIFGEPEAPKKLEEKLPGILEKVNTAAGHAGIPVALPPAAPAPASAETGPLRPLPLPVPVPSPIRQAQAKVEKAKDEIKEEVEEVRDTVKDSAEKVAGSLKGGISNAVQNRRVEAAAAAEAAERESLIRRAVQHNIPWQDKPLEQLRGEVVAAETEAAAKAAEDAPNARCPLPRCGNPLRINPNLGGKLRCPHCKRQYSATAALRLGAPMGPGMLRPGMAPPGFGGFLR